MSSVENFLTRVNWSALDVASRQRVLARPVLETDQQLRQAVADLILEVRRRGDAALIELARRLDQAEIRQLRADLAQPAVARQTREQAPVLQALDQAVQRLRVFHEAGMPKHYAVETAPGVTCSTRYLPLQRVGLYIPAGSAPLISTLAMLSVPAQLAGCDEIILCSPPQPANGEPTAGECDPTLLAAARQLGITQVFRCGGAQAIAAMAYGTDSIPRCDKIFGPGNRWVTEAKRQVAAAVDGVAIDMPAGPSEVMVIADAAADPHKVALDLLSQAEHGPDSQVLLVTDSETLIAQVETALAAWLRHLPRADTARQALRHSRAIHTADLATAVAVANDYAPEHLILQVADDQALLPDVRHAGSVFCGAWTPESLGDYCSGTNHVLPTGGWARSHSGLAVVDFMRRMTVQSASRAGLEALGPIAETLAACEGLDAHRLAVSYRLDKVQP